MRPIKRSCLLLVPALLLAACGNSGKSDSTTVAPPRGTLLQSPPELLSTVTAPTLLLELNTATNQQLLSLSGAPVCDILIYHIQYTTVRGADGAYRWRCELHWCASDRLVRAWHDDGSRVQYREHAKRGDAVTRGAVRITGLHRGRAKLRRL